MTVYGYARVSTAGQKRYGKSIEFQKKCLKEAGCDVIYTEIASATKDIERPEFNKMIDGLKTGDTVIVKYLDRFSRKQDEAMSLLERFMKEGITFRSLDVESSDKFNGFENNPMYWKITWAVIEANETGKQESARAGTAMAKVHSGFHEGRPAMSIDMKQFRELSIKCSKKQITVNDACRELNISRTSWYKLKRMQAA